MRLGYGDGREGPFVPRTSTGATKRRRFHIPLTQNGTQGNLSQSGGAGRSICEPPEAPTPEPEMETMGAGAEPAVPLELATVQCTGNGAESSGAASVELDDHDHRATTAQPMHDTEDDGSGSKPKKLRVGEPMSDDGPSERVVKSMRIGH